MRYVRKGPTGLYTGRQGAVCDHALECGIGGGKEFVAPERTGIRDLCTCRDNGGPIEQRMCPDVCSGRIPGRPDAGYDFSP